MLDITIKIPSKGTYFHIYEGSGDNLLDEDKAEGFKDYLNYDEYDSNGNELDGGLELLREYISDICKTREDFAKMFLELYGLGPGASYEIIDDKEAHKLGFAF